MKKIFLTSGVILCMACPAMATTDIAANATSDSCVYNVLGSYTGPVSFEAKWDPKISGAITLISDRYETSSSASVASDGNASPDGAPATLYSRYGEGLYDTSAHATAGGATGKVTDLTTDPALTGYTFKGFWTGKAKTGTQVIDYDGTVLPAALVQVPTNTTATWYAGWDPNKSGAITLDSSVYPGNDHAQAAKYTTSSSEAVTAASPSTVYSVYNTGMYSNADATTSVTALAPNTPSKLGYVFGGFKTADGTVTVIDSSGQFTADAKTQITATGGTATWYAQWTPKTFNISYEAGTCTGAGRTITDGLTYDTNYTVLGMGNATTASGVTEPTGYTFQNWTESIGGTATGETRDAGYTYTPWHTDNGTLTLTANCTANDYTITYDCGSYTNTTVTPNINKTVANGGITVSTSISGYDSSTKKVVQTAKFATTNYTYVTASSMCSINQGYTVEWSCKDASNNAVTPTNGTWNIASNVTCTAVWTPNTIGLTWYTDSVANNGTVISGTTPNCTYDLGIDIPAQPTKNGYTFDGWKVRTNAQ